MRDPGCGRSRLRSSVSRISDLGSRIPHPETLNQYPSVQLFVARARAAAASFEMTPRNAPSIAQVCRQLDGIPLAIELAAARVRAMPVEMIAGRLDDRFRLLPASRRNSQAGSPTRA